MSDSSRPASATAARQASTVRDSGSTRSRRPRAERPTPESTDACSKRWSPSGGRGGGEPGGDVGLRGGDRAGRLEEGEPYVVALPRSGPGPRGRRATSAGVAADDVGGQPHGRVLGQRHHGDDVGGWQVRVPLVLVDGVAHDGGPARDRGRGRVAAAAHRTDRHRRVDQGAAVVTALDAEGPVGAGGPEPSAPRGELGEGPHRSTGDAVGIRRAPAACPAGRHRGGARPRPPGWGRR